MKILVVIVSYKSYKDLKKCLERLIKLNLDLKIVIVDNFGDIQKNEKYDLIKTKTNVGFARGVNLALKKHLFETNLNYDFVWLLNPDTEVEIQSQIKWPVSDIFSPVIYRPDGKIWFAGGKINRWTGEVEIETNNMSASPSQKASADTWVSGCSMFVKPKVFEKIGLFDEKFILFYEDVDFCLRAKKAGFKIGIINNLKVIHKISQSIDKLGAKMKYQIECKSKSHFLKKHWLDFFPSAHLISFLRSIKHRLLYY